MTDVRSFFLNIVEKYEKYVKKTFNERKKEVVTNDSDWGIFFGNGNSVENSSTENEKERIVFRSLNEYLSKYDEKTISCIFQDNVISRIKKNINFDEKQNYDFLSNVRKRVFNEIVIEQKKLEEEEEEKRLLELKKLEEKKKEIESFIPRFNTGNQYHTSLWNEFFYTDDDSAILRYIFLENTSVSNIFVNIFRYLFKYIKNESDIIKVSDMTYQIPMRSYKDLNEHFEYRKYVFYLGFIFNEPLVEKELNEHICYFALNIWWNFFISTKNITDETYLFQKQNEAYDQMIFHYREKLLPLLKKIISKSASSGTKTAINESNIIFFQHLCFPFTDVRNGKCHDLMKLSFTSENESIDLEIWLNEYESILEPYFHSFSLQKRQTMMKKTNNERIEKITNMNSKSTESVSETSFSQKPNVKTLSESLLEWFIDSSVSDAPIYSEYTEIELEGATYLISHINRNYKNYESFFILKKYLQDPHFMETFIFSNDMQKPPNLNISECFYIYLSNIMINCYAYDNNNENENQKIAETVFLQMIYFLETKYKSFEIEWWIYDQKDDLLIQENYLDFIYDRSNLLYTSANYNVEKKIFTIIFKYLFKKCFFNTIIFMIELFLLNNKENAFFDKLIENIQEDAFFTISKHRENPIVQFLLYEKTYSFRKGKECLKRMILSFISEIRNETPGFCILRMRMIQNHFFNERMNTSNGKKKKLKTVQEFKESIDEEFKSNLLTTLENNNYWKNFEIITKEENVIEDFLKLKKNDFSKKIEKMNDVEISDSVSNFISFLLKKVFMFSKSNPMLKIQKTMNEYISLTFLKILDQINWIDTDIDSFFTRILLIISKKDIFKKFLNSVLSYLDRTSVKILSNLEVDINRIFKESYQKKAINKEISLLDEIIFYLLLFHLCEIHFHSKKRKHDDLYLILIHTIEKRKHFFLENHMTEEKSCIKYSFIPEIDFSNSFQINSISQIFDRYDQNELVNIFDHISAYIQLSILFTHHFNWKCLEETVNLKYLQLLKNRNDFVINSKSFQNNISEDDRYNISLDCNFKIYGSEIDLHINVIFMFEQFFLEKYKSMSKISFSLNDLYSIADKCKKKLSKNNYNFASNVTSKTPENMMITYLCSFLKMKILQIFETARQRSHSPENAFMIILSQEKAKTVQIMMTIMNFILSVHSRIKLASALRDHCILEKKDVEYSNDFLFNPLKYAVNDSLLKHSFFIRMMQKTLTTSELLSFAWIALPDDVAREYFSDSNITTKQKIMDLSIDLRLFKMKTNPKNSRDWKLWFLSLPHVVNPNYNIKNYQMPKLGRIYCLNDFFTEKPKNPFLSAASSSNS